MYILYFICVFLNMNTDLYMDEKSINGSCIGSFFTVTMVLEYILSSKEKPRLLKENFLYIEDYTRNGRTRWKI